VTPSALSKVAFIPGGIYRSNAFTNYTFSDLLSTWRLGQTIPVKVENDNRFHLASVATASVKRLSEVPLNRSCRIERLEGPRQDCDRLLDLGFTPGEDVIVTHAAPLGDPLVIRVRGTLLALRKREAAWILVE
jgi:ferrous iron transport protein A